MKIKPLIIIYVFAISLAACSPKEESVKKSATESTENKEVIQKAKEAVPAKTNDSATLATEPAKATGNSTKKPPVTGNATPDQTLSETIEHAQTVTKTQKSEARQRGQKAVDEMMMEVEKSK